MRDYIIGLLTADGTTTEHTSIIGDKTYSSNLELAESQILEDIAKEIGVNVFYRKRVIKNKERHFYRIHLNNNFLKQDGVLLLSGRVGIFKYYLECKSKNDFIRGLFDGDGCVCVRTGRTIPVVTFSINSQCDEIKQIIEHFCKENNISISTYLDKRGVGSWYISINRKLDILKFYELMYSHNPKLLLKRKYEKFIQNGFPNLVMD